MAEKFLGPAFEIHGGGLDLVFPHHENEIAQSRGAGREFARIWMHNGMLRLAGEKMSKSLGNIVPLRDSVEEWGRETVLLYFMTAHWRKPMDFSDEVMEQAAAQVESFRNVFRGPSAEGGDFAEFGLALDDDFDTPRALAVMHDWRRNRQQLPLRMAFELFGLDALAEEERAPSDVVALAEQREDARAARDFPRSDELRSEIDALGWEVRDEAGGFRLVRKQ
jgi:cysteinyl-tRNA synthetase